uniref:EamA domain-containing protein n=1 Tax=Peronospora matthiolae TaxID=2874970 RepID=A0AAV1VC02_9STRA
MKNAATDRARGVSIETDVPSTVYTLDLHRLSDLARVSMAELVRGMQQLEDVVEMQGVVVNRGQDVPFEAVGRTPEDIDHADSQDDSFMHVQDAGSGIKQVLLTAASSTMCLDGSDTPKCLLMLGEYTLMEHILAQLFVAGIQRVVVIISYFGHEIMTHVKESFLYTKLQIEFLNLGEETSYGHARTLLSAREMFTEPFLIHTADHVFDRAIISRLAQFDLDDCVACVLVDTDKNAVKGLPSTAGKVRLNSSDGTISEIGRGLKHFDAIDAGLFLATKELFAALEMLAYEKPKFSLAEALNVLRPSYGLKFVETDGDAWLSVETQVQLDEIVANNSIALLSLWPVIVAKEPVEEASTTSGGKNVFLAVSAADDDSVLRAVKAHVRQPAHVFEGFVVGVDQVREVGVEDKTAPARESIQAHENTPLLDRSVRTASHRDRDAADIPLTIWRQRGSFLKQAGHSFVLSMPYNEPSDVTVGIATAEDEHRIPSAAVQHAYLIQLPQVTAARDGSGAVQETLQQFVLAVPSSDTLYKRPGLSRRLSSLPSAVKAIKVETVEFCDSTMKLRLLVKRQVPFAGYVLLLASLVSISSLGTALESQRNVNPFMKFFWRLTASLVVFIPLAGAALYDRGPPRFSTQNMIHFLTCSISYAVFLTTFLWSLSHTSIDHAYIFNNCHSLLMVVGRLMLGRYVSQFEGLGTAIGVIGGALTTLDHQPSSSTGVEVVQVSLTGDLVALVGALGGALYLLTVKKLRTEIDVSILFAGMFLLLTLLTFPVFSLLDIPFEASQDPDIGLFGWLHPSRAASEAYIVLVCTLVGTVGYVAVMKYFAPIVISVVMLVEPVLAAFMAVAVTADTFPGLLTVVGSSLIIAGTALVIASNSSRTQAVDATLAISYASSDASQNLSSTISGGFKLRHMTTPTTNVRYV